MLLLLEGAEGFLRRIRMLISRARSLRFYEKSYGKQNSPALYELEGLNSLPGSDNTPTILSYKKISTRGNGRKCPNTITAPYS